MISVTMVNMCQSSHSLPSILFILIITLFITSISRSSVEAAKGKKKVLIIGEIPDEAGSYSSPSHSYDDDVRVGERVRVRDRHRDGSVFVPVAAYSVTHSRVAGDKSRDRGSVRRSRPGKDQSYSLRLNCLSVTAIKVEVLLEQFENITELNRRHHHHQEQPNQLFMDTFKNLKLSNFVVNTSMDQIVVDLVRREVSIGHITRRPQPLQVGHRFNGSQHQNKVSLHLLSRS